MNKKLSHILRFSGFMLIPTALGIGGFYWPEITMGIIMGTMSLFLIVLIWDNVE